MRGAFLVIIIALELHGFAGTPRVSDSSMKNIFLSGRRCAGLAFGVVGFFGIHFGPARAATINANSPSFTDVSAAIASASDGDTVIIPAGTATWTSTLTITKGITLIGQTTTNSDDGTATDNTIITENLTRDSGGNAVLFWFNTNLGKTYRLSGLTFREGSTTPASNAMIRFMGTSQAVRLDHCHFDDLTHEDFLIGIGNWPLYGVIDHNVFDFTSAINSHASIQFASSAYGDDSWTQPAYFGSEKFMFAEDNYFNNTSGNFYGGVVDVFIGGRAVLRHNHCHDVVLVGNHGTESGRYRGGRAMEVYNNDFHWPYSRDVGGVRSGSIVLHDNTHDGATLNNVDYAMQLYRLLEQGPGGWDGATGDNPWDVNATESDGTHVDGHAPYLFESGTATGGFTSGGTAILTDTTKTWTTNQWANYEVKKLSGGKPGEISSNGSNSLTTTIDTGYGGGATWTAGDQYQIHKVLIVLDQLGRGAGDLITGDTPINQTTGNAAWPHQALEPCYCWNDVYTPTNTTITLQPTSNSTGVLTQGRDYINGTPMPGYTPYTYPHPLVSGGGHGPESPGDLHVTQ
jgi:hypothetical protein